MQRSNEFQPIVNEGADMDIFSIWPTHACEQFVRQYEEVIAAEIGDQFFWPIGDFTCGDVVCYYAERKILVMLHVAPNEILFPEMPFSEFFLRLMNKEVTLEDDVLSSVPGSLR